jgi:hypothetical protein
MVGFITNVYCLLACLIGGAAGREKWVGKSSWPEMAADGGPYFVYTLLVDVVCI